MEMNNSVSEGHPIPLIICRDKKYILDSEGERILKQERNNKIGIIALVGKYRTGKSFLLNRVLLNKKNHGFGVGPTIKPCTKVFFNLFREYGYGQNLLLLRIIITLRNFLFI